jgi:hypothetical protein
MTGPKRAATAALIVTSLLVAALSAHAKTARQYAFQGQGVYITSKGVPEGFVATLPGEQQSFYGDTVANPPKDLEHHGRYFGGF